MATWYYSFNGEKFGPVSLEELRRLAADGVLAPHDLVWKPGQPDWQRAAAVPELPFAQEPPPLPAQPLLNQVWENNWENFAGQCSRWVWARKPILFGLGLVLSVPAIIFLVEERADAVFVVAASILCGICVLGLIVTGGIALTKSFTIWQRQTWLKQKWESANNDGHWVQFSDDGGFLDSHGLGAKYLFHPADDKIQLRPTDGSAPIEWQVVLLSEKELAIACDGKTQHYKKPSWWKKVFGG